MRRCQWLAVVLSTLPLFSFQAQPPPAAVRSSRANQIEEGKRVFAMNCSVGYCHGLEGRAGKGPRLRDRAWSGTYLYDTIENGIPNSSMPPWQGRLTSKSIDAVVAYVLSISGQQAIGNSATGAAGVPEDGRESASSTQSVDKEIAIGKALFFDPMKDRNCGVPSCGRRKR